MTERTPYSDPQWKVVRPQVFERDGYACQLHLPRCKGTATHVDHIIDWRDGGDWFALPNLQASCSSCNVAKRNRGVAARARAQRGMTTSDYGTDTLVITDLTWLSPEEIATYGPPPAPGQPPRRVRRR